MGRQSSCQEIGSIRGFLPVSKYIEDNGSQVSVVKEGSYKYGKDKS